MARDRFVPDNDPKAPALCTRCNTPITIETAMECVVDQDNDDGLDIRELVCLKCFVDADTTRGEK